MLAGLDATTEYAEIDYQSVVNEIADRRAEHASLTGASSELARLDTELKTTGEQISAAERAQTSVNTRNGRVDGTIADAETTQADVQAILGEAGCQAASAHFSAISALLAAAGHQPPSALAACDKAEGAAEREITRHSERLADRQARLATRIVTAMTDFRRQYPVETSELDSSVEAADGYRELHERLSRDDLLAHQAQWVTEPTPVTATLPLLTAEEQATYQALLAGTYGRAIRLEQERIRFSALEHALQTLPLGRSATPSR